VLLHLIHHLVGFGVLKNSLLIWLAFVLKAEDALFELAHQGKFIFSVLDEVL